MTDDARRYLAAAERVVETFDAISKTRALNDAESLALERAMHRVDYWKSIIAGETK